MREPKRTELTIKFEEMHKDLRESISKEMPWAGTLGAKEMSHKKIKELIEKAKNYNAEMEKFGAQSGFGFAIKHLQAELKARDLYISAMKEFGGDEWEKNGIRRIYFKHPEYLGCAWFFCCENEEFFYSDGTKNHIKQNPPMIDEIKKLANEKIKRYCQNNHYNSFHFEVR